MGGDIMKLGCLESIRGIAAVQVLILHIFAANRITDAEWPLAPRSMADWHCYFVSRCNNLLWRRNVDNI
jgi:hypothetical protein